MIKTKEDLIEYMRCDQIALHCEEFKRPRFGRDEIWKFERLLRKAEYYTNNKKHIIHKLCYVFYKYRFHKMSVQLGFSIPVNVFDKGLSIAHYGPIVINHKAKIGKNCRIQESVTIGSTGGNDGAPEIGDHVFIASGARIIGDVVLGNHIAVGANAVVTKSFKEDHITLAGVPARKISNHGSEGFVCRKLLSEKDQKDDWHSNN